MSNLTTEQLDALYAAVVARLQEFDMPNALLPARGVVRLIVDVYAEADWEPVARAVIPVPDDEPPPEFYHRVDPITSKEQPAERTLSRQAAATLGPEHTVVTPLKNGNGEHKPTREERIKQELGEDAPARGKLPTKAELIAEIKRISMAGMMPTMAAFDAARPAVWATAQAHCLRLKTNWTELAAEADLTIRTGPSGTESNP